MATAPGPSCSSKLGFASTSSSVQILGKVCNNTLTQFSLVDSRRSRRLRTFLLVHRNALQPVGISCSVPSSSSFGPSPPLTHLNQLNTTDTKPVGVEDYDNVHSLLQILPPDLRNTLLHDSRQSQLLEVVLDLGKLPQAHYIGHSRRQFLRSTEVTLEELQYAQNVIGEFGDDNRAGIVGPLHRISAIGGRKGEIIGLTCLVVRVVQGNISMVRDLLNFGDSILFVGRLVAKLSPIKAWCWQNYSNTGDISHLSDEFHKRVVIVDNSSEIGGEGDISLSTIGGARRLQVPKSFMQMIEAVKNHIPEVIIVDEIGTKVEVNACRTIAERGIMLIGTAHAWRTENCHVG